MAKSSGSAVGRYQIVGFLARGETSVVYEALEPGQGRQVALKILPPSAARDPEKLDHFLRLADRLSTLDHANLLPLIDYGQEGGVPYITMPVAAGGCLADHIDAFRDPEVALALLAGLAQAVDYLHQNQLIHGRIAPRHVLLGERGEPLLIGVGRPYPPADADTTSAVPAPPYLAPEQRQNLPPDERTDIYQLGALLYHLLLGELPEPGPDLVAAGLDGNIASILARALAVDPDERFQAAADLADQLALASQPASAQEAIEDLRPAIDEHPDPAPEAAPATSLYGRVGALRDGNPLVTMVAFVTLAILLVLCCVLASYAVYTVNNRVRQPRVTARVDTNVRAGPAIAYPIVGLLRQGQPADLYGISPDGNWWQIAFEGAPNHKGWVPAAFVTVDRLGTVAVVEPPPLSSEASLPRSPLVAAVADLPFLPPGANR